MDELKDKLKKLSFFGGSNKSGAFKGTAHRLGSAPAQSGVPAPRPAPAAPPQRPVLVVPQQPPQQQPQQQPQRHRSTSDPASSSRGGSPHVAMQPTATQQPPAQPATLLPPVTQVPPALQAQPHITDDVPEEVGMAVGQLASDPAGASAAEVLSKLLRNIVAAPGEAKFRRVRLSNPRIQSAVVHASGGVELLLACGFEIVFEEAAAAAAAGAGGGASGAGAAASASASAGAGPSGSGSGSSGGGGGAAEATAGDGAGTVEGYAVLAEDADLATLQHALRLLGPLLTPASGSGASAGAVQPAAAAAAAAGSSSSSSRNAGSPSVGSPLLAARPPQPAAPQPSQQQQQARPARPPREWEAPRERNTQVLLPTSVERDVPDWFFQRTGAELKATFLTAVRRREQDQVLMTRAMRERLRAGGAGKAPAPRFATIRVRFPEGISLQGEFGAGEPVAAVFAWVADCLSDPLHTYELVLPSRQTLEAAPKSVREADLLPSVALLFRWTGQSAVEMAQAPALRPELLRDARPATASY